MDLSRTSTTEIGYKQGSAEARERRWESTFFMINVIFLLILFFIVAARFDVHLLVVPPRSAADAPLPPTAPQLTVTADGQLFFNGEAIARPELQQAIRRAGAGRDLRIAADGAADALAIAGLIDEAGEAGVTRVAIVTLAREPPARP